jgi:hypothetical protein
MRRLHSRTPNRYWTHENYDVTFAAESRLIQPFNEVLMTHSPSNATAIADTSSQRWYKVNRFRRLLRLDKTQHRLSVLSVKQHLLCALRTMAPTLLALSLTSVAHAQGTMDFSGATTLMTTFKTFAIYAGAVICFGGLIFAGIRMMSGRFAEAIPGLFGALFGAGVLGWGAGWIGSLTGQTMQ